MLEDTTLKMDNVRKKNVRKLDKSLNNVPVNKKIKKSNKFSESEAPFNDKFLIERFESDIKIGINEWVRLLTDSILVTDFNSSIPHLWMFEKMLNKISKIYSGSELANFFTDLINKLEIIDITVITLMFEWCFILFWKRKFLQKSQVRENVSYETIKSVISGIMRENTRNYLILLICCDINISKKYFFPNSHLISWFENMDYVSDIDILQDNIWKFSLGILEDILSEVKKGNKSFNLTILENSVFCEFDDYLGKENDEVSIHFFEKVHNYFDNSKLLILFVNSTYRYLSYKSKIFPSFIDILLNSHITKTSDIEKFSSKIKSENKNRSTLHKNQLFLSLDPYELIVYTIISLILSYYAIEYDFSGDFYILYEESYNILHYLTKSDQLDNSSFYVYESNKHVKTIDKTFKNLVNYSTLWGGIDNYIFDNKDSLVLLIFNSILEIYKSKHIYSEKNVTSSENTVIDEILITLLFLTMLHPNTTDSTLTYLLRKIYQDLYSFGFLLIGSCISLLFKKDIFSEGISKRVQLNILNFRSIHAISSHIFPYIQFFNCIYYLISESNQNYKFVNTIFQFFEDNFIQYLNEDARNDNINEVEICLSINISLALNSVYLKLLEFFALNPSLCKLFFKMKFQDQLRITKKIGSDENEHNILNHSIKPSLLDVFNKLSTRRNITNNDGTNFEYLKCDKFKSNVSKHVSPVSMCYSTMIHILGIIYIPVIKRANMSLYIFNYFISPSVFSIKDFHINDSNIESENLSLIQKESLEIPKLFCIEFLEEITSYCKSTNQQSPFEVDRFVVNHALEVKNSSYKSISSLTHTCRSNGFTTRNCFSCSIDSYSEYLGIINSVKTSDKYHDYYFSKSWANHGVIISLITLIGGKIDVYGMNELLESEVNTHLEFLNKSPELSVNSLNTELLMELIKMLSFEIKDDVNIRKESGDIQRILFRSLLIYLLHIIVKNRILEESIPELNLDDTIVRLCHLFTFRIECLSANTNSDVYFANETNYNSFSTPSRDKSHIDRDYENSNTSGGYYSPKSTSSKNTNLSTPKIKRITPIVISGNNQTEKTLKDLNLFFSYADSDSCNALREKSDSYSSIFHLKVILNTLETICELRQARKNNSSIISRNDLQPEVEEYILDILEKSLFFLLPSNTFHKRSIFRFTKMIEPDKQNRLLDTIHECSENSEAEEIEGSNEDEKVICPSYFSFNTSKSEFVQFLLNDNDFSKTWYIDVIVTMIRYLFINTKSIKDVSSLITDIASKTMMWNRKENKKTIFKVCTEILKFTFDYFYDGLTEISLCLLRNNGSQLLSSVKFVFVALLDQNSKLMDNSSNELPSIYVINELEELHRSISLFHSITRTFEICFGILIDEDIISDRDDIWIKNAISFMDRGTEALGTELSKMEKIILLPEVDTQDDSLFEGKNPRNGSNYEGYDYEDIWNKYINNCILMLRECKFIIKFISINWEKPNKDLLNNGNNASLNELNDELDNFITFEECEEGVIQGDKSYTDIKITPHWNTFIKSLFL